MSSFGVGPKKKEKLKNFVFGKYFSLQILKSRYK